MFLHAVSAMAVSGCSKFLPIYPQPVFVRLALWGQSLISGVMKEMREGFTAPPRVCSCTSKRKSGRQMGRDCQRKSQGGAAVKKTPTKQRVRIKHTAILFLIHSVLFKSLDDVSWVLPPVLVF